MSITIKTLNFSYINNRVFENLTLEFSSNKIHGILGPNGCGKTTLLKTILKLLKIENDKIFVKNKDINKYEREKFAKKIAYVEQSSTQLPQISVKDYINLARYLFDDYNDLKNKVVDETICLLKIEHLKDKLINQLSGGELQKVIIARALAQESEILILDEPTTSLDPLHQLQIMNLLQDLIKEKKLTIILTLHDLNLALSYCDEVVLINNSKIVQGPTQSVINSDNIKSIFNLESSFTTNPFTKKNHVILNQ